MSKFIVFILVISTVSVSCQNNGKSNNSPTQDPVKAGEIGLENAGKAKRPKGSLSFEIDKTKIIASENTVQCMFVGMGSNMAQGMIMGRSENCSINIVFFDTPKVGEIDADKNIGKSLGVEISREGKSFSNLYGGEIKLSITSIKKDGNNHYISGKFSGTLTSSDGKTVTVSNGAFGSAYL